MTEPEGEAKARSCVHKAENRTNKIYLQVYFTDSWGDQMDSLIQPYFQKTADAVKHVSKIKVQ